LEVLHFINVDEYGLALETYVGSLVETRQPLPLDAEVLVRELATLMEMRDSPVLNYLEHSRKK